MNIVNPGAILAGADSVFLAFTFTKRNQPVNLSSYNCNFIVDINGDTYEKKPSSGGNVTVMFVGGTTEYIHSKSSEAPLKFYMSESQKVVLYSMMKGFAKSNPAGTVDSNSEDLYQIANSLYSNYRG